MNEASERDAPRAPRRRQVLVTHGDERIDDWCWLRDRNDPEVIAYLEAENTYAEQQLAPIAALRDELFGEFKARIQETDETPPYQWGPYWYSTRTVEGLQYEIHCRRLGGPNASEEVVLDENALATGHEFFELRLLVPSPNHRLLAYGVNYDGSDKTDLHFRVLDDEHDLHDVIEGVTENAVWASDNQTMFYVARDEALRPHQLWRYRLGDPASATLIHEEPDERFRVGVARTRSGGFLVLTIQSSTTSECWVVAADRPDDPLRLVERRRDGVRYTVDHHGDRFLIVTDADGAVNSKLVTAPVATPGAEHWTDLVPHRSDVRVYDVHPFRNHLVVAERGDAVRRLRVLAADAEAGHSGWLVEQPEEVSVAAPGTNREFDTAKFRYRYSSLVTPESIFDVDLVTGETQLVKQEPVLGYDPARYLTTREWASAPDGTRVPLSVVHRADVPLDGSAPCLLYGYGSYEICIDPSFSPFVVSYLDRGVVYAIAHIRGGGEMGRPWYEDGKFLDKRNTFSDFIACAEHLQREGYADRGRTVAMGGSAGGLLVGAVVNERPDLFAGALALVPFVDVVTTMLDESIPLTVPEFEEWGNPKERVFYDCMKSYSPYDNLRAQSYPPMLVTTGLNDTRVAFWEPAKWVAKLRATKTDRNLLVLRTEMGAGHGGPSGRYNEWKERALWYAFALWCMNAAGQATSVKVTA